MPNSSQGAYGLTLLCPIKKDTGTEQSFASQTRECLQLLPNWEHSPMARVPNTYFSRFYILNDVFFEGSPAYQDHLKSRYLVFCSDFHGTLEDYLRGFWENAQETIQIIWRHCIGFDAVHDADGFYTYIKKCQVKTTFYFNGSIGTPLREQLKALYLKQSFAEFVQNQQSKSAAEQQQAFKDFVAATQPDNLAEPTWKPGRNTLDSHP